MNEATQTLLVEGNDDYHLIRSICKAYNISSTFLIEDCNGITNLLGGLPVRLKGSGEINTIGIVIDADTDIQNRWSQIRQILIQSKRYGSIPDDCPKQGAIISPINKDDIRIGIWIMPDNNNNGMLEDFAAFLIPASDKLISEVDKVLSDIELKNLNKYKDCHHSKARIHTWLAWQEQPGTPMGAAVTKKYLSTTPPICMDFVEWIKNLFETKE